MKHKEVLVSLAIWGLLLCLTFLDAGCPANAPWGHATCQFFEQHSDVLNPLYFALYAAAILSTFACIFLPVLRNLLP